MSEPLGARSRNANRIAWRFARRTILRHRVRSLLIAIMVAVPVIGVMGMATVAQSLIPTTEQHLTATLGRAQASILMLSPPDASGHQTNLDAWSYAYDTDENGLPTQHEDGGPVEDPASFLPADTRILRLVTATVQARTTYGLGGFQVTDGSTWDPSLRGRYTIESGRTPATSSQIMVSPQALVRLGIEVGGTVHVVSPEERDLTVVGVLRDRQAGASASQLFSPPGTLVTGASANPFDTEYVLPDLAVDADLMHTINLHGGGVNSRELFENPPPGLHYDAGGSLAGYASLIGGLAGYAIFQVCLLAGAAFLVGTRADVRAIATMASVGADRRVAFRSVTFGGLALGLAGGVLGAVLGVVGGVIAYTALDDGTLTTYPGLNIPWAIIALVLLLGVGCGWLSSLVGARSAGRTDIARAMRGLGRPSRPRRRALVAGVALMIAGGVAIAAGGWIAWLAGRPQATDLQRAAGPTLLVVGAVLVQLGVILAVPLVLHGFARLFGRASTPARLAARDAARNSARSVPVLAAVMTTVFLAASIATFAASLQRQTLDNWTMSAARGTATVDIAATDDDGSHWRTQADPSDVESVLQSTFPSSRMYAMSALTQSPGDPSAWVSYPGACPDQQTGWGCGPYAVSLGGYIGATVVVAEPRDLGAYLGIALTPAQRQALADGSALVTNPEYLVDGRLVIDEGSAGDVDAETGLQGAPTVSRHVTLPVVRVTPHDGMSVLAAITPETAAAHDLPTTVAQVAFHLDHAPTDIQRDAVQASLATVLPNGGYLDYADLPADFAATAAWILLAVAAIIMAGSSAVAIGLARSDARRDDEVLDAIGSPPALRRRIALWQGLVIAGVGAVLGTAIGVLPNLALAVQYANGPDADPVLPVDPPWLQLGLLAIGVPVVIALASWATAGRARVRVRRAA